MNEWSYVLLQRDDQGTIIDSQEVTDEVLSLFKHIEMQENIIKAYRKSLGITIFDESTTKH